MHIPFVPSFDVPVNLIVAGFIGGLGFIGCGESTTLWNWREQVLLGPRLAIFGTVPVVGAIIETEKPFLAQPKDHVDQKSLLEFFSLEIVDIKAEKTRRGS